MANKDVIELDCLGERCPIPLLRTKQAARDGARRICVRADDPLAEMDLRAFAIRAGFEVESSVWHSAKLTITLARAT
jgi:TusA-related sulfurtransferase